MAEKIRVFFVIDFERLVPEIRFVGSGIIGKKTEENHWWRATDVKEDVKKKMAKVTKKEIIPERIFVPFFWCWLGEGKKGEFKKQSSDYSKVRNMLKEWVDYERKEDEGKSAYHMMTCLHITKRFLARCFTQSEKYIGRKKDGVLEKGNIYVFDYHQLKDARYKVDKEALEFLDEDLGILGKDFPLSPGLDKEKVEKCIDSYATMPSSEIIEKSGDIEDRFKNYCEGVFLTCLEESFKDSCVKINGQIQDIKSKLKSLDLRITEGKYQIEEFDLNHIADYSLFEDFSKMLKGWWDDHENELEGNRFEEVIGQLNDEIELEFLKKLAGDDALRNYLEDLRAYVHPRIRWKQLCIRMFRLKDDLVFGRFPLNKVFVEPTIDGRPAFQFLDETLKQKKIVVILNEFGMGKSSLCKAYASLLADRYLNDESRTERIPIFLKLGDFFKVGQGEEQLLKSYVKRKYEFNTEEDYLFNRSYCFLADGFDEAERYSEDDIKSCFETLEHLSDYKDSRMIMTARPGVFAHLPAVEREKLSETADIVNTKIQDFSQEKIEAWLDNWHKRLGQEKISYSNLQVRGLEELAQNPLLLYMIVNVYRELGEKKEYKRAYIYSRFIDQTIGGRFKEDHEGKYHPKFCFKSPNEYRKILQEIAYHIFTANKAVKFQEVSRILKEKFNKPQEKIKVAGSTIICHFFREVETGIYNFAHQTFMEYLNAERILRILLALVDPENDEDNQNILEAKFALCDQLITQPIFDFLRELADTRSRSKEDKKRLCSLLQDWYACDDLLLAFHDKRFSKNKKHISLPSANEKSLNIRVLSLILFIYLSSSLAPRDRRIEISKFFFGELLERCHVGVGLPPRTDLLLINNLSSANLRGAVLVRANLRGANLRNVDLKEANFPEVDLTGADLRGASLSGASLVGASLRDADLRGADLKGVNFADADLRGANLRRAHLVAARFIVARLTGVNLERANLERAILWRSDLTGANLVQADLTGANLAEVALYDVEGWVSIIGFERTDITNAQGLSKEETEYALERGAICRDGKHN